MLDEGLRAVAVVHIPVDDQHPIATGASSLGGEQGDVVSVAEPHRAMPQGVVPRRADGREGVPLSVEGVGERGAGGPSRRQRGTPGRRPDGAIRAIVPGATAAHRLELLEIGGIVERGQPLGRRWCGIGDGDTRRGESLQHRAQTRRLFRHAAARVVRQARRCRHDKHRVRPVQWTGRRDRRNTINGAPAGMPLWATVCASSANSAPRNLTRKASADSTTRAAASARCLISRTVVVGVTTSGMSSHDLVHHHPNRQLGGGHVGSAAGGRVLRNRSTA